MRLTLPCRRRGGTPSRALTPAADPGYLYEPRMVPVMIRRISMLSVVGLLVAGFGCRHIGGKCDCGAHPADAVIAGPTTPYPTAPVLGGGPAPIPPSGNGALPDKLPPK